MYRVDKPTKRRNLAFKIMFVVAISSLIFAGWIWLTKDASRTAISNNDEALTGTLVDDSAQKRPIEEDAFRMQLPSDWTRYQQDASNDVFYYKSTKKNADDRNLAVYVDKIPQDLAVNRVVPVTAQGNKMVAGEVSDNCANFTGSGSRDARAAQSQPDTPSRWQNVQFICDLSHVNRNAIGISSAEGINKVTLTGQSGRTRTFFLLYTDHNRQQDPYIFKEVLRSFEAK